MVRVPKILADMVPPQLRQNVDNITVVDNKSCTTFIHHHFNPKLLRENGLLPEKEIQRVSVLYASYWTLLRSLGRDGFRVRYYRRSFRGYDGVVEYQKLEILVCRPAIVLVSKWTSSGKITRELVFIV